MAECRADLAEALDTRLDDIAGGDGDHRAEGAGHDDIAGLAAARPYFTIVSASQTAALSGLPMQAAPEPVETVLAAPDQLIAQLTRSARASGTLRAPSTKWLLRGVVGDGIAGA